MGGCAGFTIRIEVSRPVESAPLPPIESCPRAACGSRNAPRPRERPGDVGCSADAAPERVLHHERNRELAPEPDDPLGDDRMGRSSGLADGCRTAPRVSRSAEIRALGFLVAAAVRLLRYLSAVLDTRTVSATHAAPASQAEQWLTPPYVLPPCGKYQFNRVYDGRPCHAPRW